MLKILGAALLCLFAFAAKADPAQIILNLTFTGPTATGITCPLSNPYTVPVAAGSVICHYTISPTTWQGGVSPSGTDAAAFTLVPTTANEGDLKVGASAITTTTPKTVTITAIP